MNKENTNTGKTENTIPDYYPSNPYKIAADKEYKKIKEQINFIIKYGKYFKV